jgi:hypothetical protein
MGETVKSGSLFLRAHTIAYTPLPSKLLSFEAKMAIPPLLAWVKEEDDSV